MRICFVFTPYMGHCAAALELAQNYIKKGDKVFFWGTNNNRESIESIGASYKYLYFMDERFLKAVYCNHDLRFSADDIVQYSYQFAQSTFRSTNIIAEHLFNEIKKLEIDLIIYESGFLGIYIIAKKLDIPCVSIITHYPMSKNVINEYPHFFVSYILRKDYRLFLEHDCHILAKKIINTIYDFSEKNHCYELFNTLFADPYNKKDVEMKLLYTIKEFHLAPQDFKDNYHFIGRNVMYNSNYKRDIIYISQGSMRMDNISFIKKCVDALKTLDIKVLISSSSDISEYNNISVQNYVNQIEILNQSIIYINLGGLTGVNEALALGVPMIIMPLGFDQHLTAASLIKYNLGYVLDYDTFTPNELKHAVSDLINNQNILDNMQYFKERFSKQDSDNAIDIIGNQFFP